MLKDVVLDQLFDIEYKVDDITIDSICDEISDYNFEIIKISNFDMFVYIDFTFTNELVNFVGSLRINRLDKEFEFNGHVSNQINSGKSMYMPINTNNFNRIIEYLGYLRMDLSNYSENICINNGLYEFRGLQFKPKSKSSPSKIL